MIVSQRAAATDNAVIHHLNTRDAAARRLVERMDFAMRSASSREQLVAALEGIMADHAVVLDNAAKAHAHAMATIEARAYTDEDEAK